MYHTTLVTVKRHRGFKNHDLLIIDNKFRITDDRIFVYSYRLYNNYGQIVI